MLRASGVGFRSEAFFFLFWGGGFGREGSFKGTRVLERAFQNHQQKRLSKFHQAKFN